MKNFRTTLPVLFAILFAVLGALNVHRQHYDHASFNFCAVLIELALYLGLCLGAE